MGRTYDRVIVSDTLLPEFFKDAALNKYSIQVTRVSQTELRNMARNARNLGMYATGTFLIDFMQALSDQIVRPYYNLFKTDVTLDPGILFIVVSSDPFAPYTAYTCVLTPEGVGTEKQLINYIDVYCTKH